MSTISALRKKANISYLGGTTHSAKMRYSYENGTETYCIYLAPSNMSGYSVCPNDKFCKAFCLNNSGHNKADILAHGMEKSKINLSRIKKTKLFFEDKDTFMKLLIQEISRAEKKAHSKGMAFSVRLNGTSDISPEDFVYMGKNILEWFPNIQFYDYTKVHTRFDLINKYPNYDLTYSYNGYNWNACKGFLERGGKVAVVFEKELPKTFNGFKVIDANGYDMRYLDPRGTIMGLHYHPTANDYVNGKYVRPNSKFIVMDDDVRCEF